MIRFILLLFCSLTILLCHGQSWFSSSTINKHQPEIGQFGTINDIYFDIDHCINIRPKNQILLDSVADFITELKGYIFQLEVHSECRSDSLYNKELSQRRADTLVTYIEKRISSNRIKAVGKGESEPLSDCRCEGEWHSRDCTEEEYQHDRRVVLRIIDKVEETPGASYVILFADSVEQAIAFANQDIAKGKPFLILQSGLAPVRYSTDKDFENKYNVFYYEAGCTGVDKKLVKAYNKTVFRYLTDTYGRKWKKEIRKDVIGL